MGIAEVAYLAGISHHFNETVAVRLSQLVEEELVIGQLQLLTLDLNLSLGPELIATTWQIALEFAFFNPVDITVIIIGDFQGPGISPRLLDVPMVFLVDAPPGVNSIEGFFLCRVGTMLLAGICIAVYPIVRVHNFFHIRTSLLSVSIILL